MIMTSSPTPIRAQRFFARMTRLSIQIRSAFTLTIAHEQGEAQNGTGPNGLDGLQLTQASTNPIPYDFWWKGDLWHAASLPQSQWALIIVGELDAHFLAADMGSLGSAEKLNYSMKKRC